MYTALNNPVSVEINTHKVGWEEEMRFSCKLYASANTAELEPCICKVSIRKVCEKVERLVLLAVVVFPGDSWRAFL